MNRQDWEMEKVFANAVALEQSGRARNAIFCNGNRVIIKNGDNTVYLMFFLSSRSSRFNTPVAFYANDYESPDFRAEDGGVVFRTKSGEVQREKKSVVPGKTFDDVLEVFRKFGEPVAPLSPTFSLHRSFSEKLEDNLSHVEFVGEEGKLTVMQRDLSTGSIITLTENRVGLFSESKVSDFEPIAMRTKDLQALYYFNDKIDFTLAPNGQYLGVRGTQNHMNGLVALCFYDEMGGIKKLEAPDGGKEQEDRRSEQASDRPDKSGESGKKRKLLRRR